MAMPSAWWSMHFNGIGISIYEFILKFILSQYYTSEEIFHLKSGLIKIINIVDKFVALDLLVCYNVFSSSNYDPATNRGV